MSVKTDFYSALATAEGAHVMKRQQITTTEDIRGLGTILTFWAHPDDESFLAAGIIMAAIANGQKVVCVTATKGEEGVQDTTRWPRKHLAEIREKELAAATKVLGLTDCHWLGYMDAKCADVPVVEAAKRVTELIEKYQPDTILTFGPDGWTGHPDHQAVSTWVSVAVASTAKPPTVFHVVNTKEFYDKYLKHADEQANVFFNIDIPPLVNDADCDILFTLSDALTERKYLALKAQPSQTKSYFAKFGESFLMKSLSLECFVRSGQN